MYLLLIVLHLFASFLMIAAILLQSGKGAEMGAAFGGSSQTIFGSRGASTFLSKMTVGAAVVFMLTSLGLAILSKERAGDRSIMSSPIQQSAPAQSGPAPATPSPAVPGAPASGDNTTPAAPAGQK
ncbi:MAG TPA: preprotein translocase subunit SecG [Nitrospiria bacterium]|nr:preprotein translocase subunit SecG [Nitrospiria bacterium]